MKVKNEIYIIGSEHHNMLGLIRMLGEEGIHTNAIIINSIYNKSFCRHSRYLKTSYFVNSEEELLCLLEKAPKDSIFIPSGDDTALFLDKNYKTLSKKFILPSINKGKSSIYKYMDKYFQYDFLNKQGFNVAKSYELSLDKPKYNKSLQFPLIIKPQLSVEGKKDDIVIVNNNDDLASAINKFKNNGYDRVLIQEYITMDYECGLNGCCCNKNVILPAVLKKERIYPQRRGNVSYGKIIPIKDFTLDLNPIIKMLQKLNYNGFFDIEIFVRGNDYYINEINFRNSGNSYVYTKGGVSLAMLWIYMNIGTNISNECLRVEKEYFFRDEFLELKQLLVHNISIYNFIRAFIISKCNFILNIKDPIPGIIRILNIFKTKRVNKNENSNV